MTQHFVWILIMHMTVLGQDVPMYGMTYDSLSACKQDVAKMDRTGQAAAECAKEPILTRFPK